MRLSPDRRTRPRSCTYASASLKPLRHTTRPPPCPPASPSSAPPPAPPSPAPSAPPIAAPAQPCSGLTRLPPCKLQLRKCDSRLSSHQWRQITVIRNPKFQCISQFLQDERPMSGTICLDCVHTIPLLTMSSFFQGAAPFLAIVGTGPHRSGKC